MLVSDSFRWNYLMMSSCGSFMIDVLKRFLRTSSTRMYSSNLSASLMCRKNLAPSLF